MKNIFAASTILQKIHAGERGFSGCTIRGPLQAPGRYFPTLAMPVYQAIPMRGDFSTAHFVGEFAGVDFVGCNLSKANFEKATLTDCIFGDIRHQNIRFSQRDAARYLPSLQQTRDRSLKTLLQRLSALCFEPVESPPVTTPQIPNLIQTWKPFIRTLSHSFTHPLQPLAKSVWMALWSEIEALRTFFSAVTTPPPLLTASPMVGRASPASAPALPTTSPLTPSSTPEKTILDPTIKQLADDIQRTLMGLPQHRPTAAGTKMAARKAGAQRELA